MTYLPIIEKFRILFDVLWDMEYVLIFALLLLFFTFLYGIKRLDGRKYILFIFLSFTLVFGISIYSNYDILADTFDNFTTIFFENMYFPSIYVYIGILVISFISFITSMLNVMLKKIYKIVNGIMFTLNNILFVVILNIIAKNKIDIFSVNSLYTDTTLVAILELSMGLCVVWLLSLLVIYITNVICDRLANKKIYNEQESLNKFESVLEVNEKIVNDVTSLAINEEEVCDTISDTQSVEVIDNLSSYEEIEIMNQIEQNDSILNNTVTFNDILNGCLPVTYYDNSTVNDQYSLADPQIIYENNFNKVKSEIAINDFKIMVDEEGIEDFSINQNVENNDVIVNTYNVNDDISIEELTLKEKERLSQERLVVNTVSLNDLVEENFISNADNYQVKNDTNMLEINEKQDNKNYTVEDYKRIVNMLTSLKKHSDSTNIKIDDAVAISLISNYSIDDCLKFKNILENNLN